MNAPSTPFTRPGVCGQYRGPGLRPCRVGLEPAVWCPCRLGSPAIDHDYLGAAIRCLLNKAYLMDVGLGRVLSPEDDEKGVYQVPGRVVLVVAEGQTRRHQTGRSKDRQGRRATAEKLPEAV